jgi:hypothetical protein
MVVHEHTATDIAKGRPDPRHVLIRAIHEVRSLIKAKKDREGRPVDTVRIVLAEEWMARREQRPLLVVSSPTMRLISRPGVLLDSTFDNPAHIRWSNCCTA